MNIIKELVFYYVLLAFIVSFPITNGKKFWKESRHKQTKYGKIKVVHFTIDQ